MSNKDFQRTMRETEQRIKDHLASLSKKEAESHIYSSCSSLEASIDKIVDAVNPQDMSIFKEHIDNIYYHIGKIKGCL